MYDTGIVTCPHCKEQVEQQTKSFGCILQYFNLDEPTHPSIVSHFGGEWQCYHCDKYFYIKRLLPIKDVKAEVTKTR